jgi:rhomboid family GlyGly-CTERM serine protease
MRSVARTEALAPSVVLAGLCVGLIAAPDWLTRRLALDYAAVGAGEWWRLWTAHIVHFSAGHALLDAGAVLFVGCMAETFPGKCIVAMTLLLGAPLISVAMLLMVPNVMDYRGVSGLATLLGVIAGVGLWRTRPELRVLIASVGVLFLAKVASDAIGAPMTLTNLPANVGIAWQIHLIGIGVGLVVSIPMFGYRAQHASSAPSELTNNE